MKRQASYWHMLPEYAQARKAIWDAVNPHTGKRRIDEAFPMELRASTRNQEMIIQFINGSTWQVVGSDNFNALVGSAPAGITYSEWALANPSARAYLRPIIAENNGWQIFITTPRGRNHAYNTFKSAEKDPSAFAQRLSVLDTGVIDPERLAIERQTYIDEFGEDYGLAMFEQEYLCSFDAAIMGAYYGSQVRDAEMQHRITSIEYDRDFPVHTAWDLGYSDDTSIWFYQVIAGEVRVLRYFGANGKTMDEYFDVLAGMGYKYGIHWFPHDARAKTLASGGKSIQEMAQKALGVGNVRIVPSLSMQDGIQAARQMFPRCWFDKDGCDDGLEALAQYQREWDDKRKAFNDRPKHDWCFVGETQILTRNGMYQIMRLPESGEVLTSCGWKHYTNPRVTRKNAQLVEVVFADGLSVKCTPDHLFKTVNGWKSAESLEKGMQIQSGLTKLPNTLMEGCIDSGLVIDTFQEEGKNFIGKHGSLRLVKYLKDVTYIIKTVILQIITLKILSALMQKNTYQSLGKITKSRIGQEDLVNLPEMPQQNGTLLKRGNYGIQETPYNPKHGKNGSGLRKLVNAAGLYLTHLFERVIAKNTVLNHAKQKLTDCEGHLKRHLPVIESVKKLDETADVWCLSVPECEEFSLSNGALVHNCSHAADSFRMMAIAWREEYKEQPKPKPKFWDELTLDELWRESAKRQHSRI